MDNKQLKNSLLIKKSHKRLYITIAIIAILLIYVFFAILPYSGKLKVTTLTKNEFNTNNFYGETISHEKVKLLDDGQEAFSYRLKLIESAKQEIFFSTYGIHPDLSLDIFLGALLNKADENVKINMILDGKFASFNSNYKKALASHNNITINHFNKLDLLKPYMINVSLHDKFITADNSFLILGGRNIGDKYFDFEDSKIISKDREVFVHNTDTNKKSCIDEVKEYYYQLANSKHTTQVKHYKNSNKTNSTQNDLKKSYLNYISQKPITNLDITNNTIAVNKISFIANPINGTKKEPTIGYNLLQLAKNSSTAIVQTPYIALTNSTFNSIFNTIKAQNITLLTNSLASAANLPAYSTYNSSRKKFAKTNLNIYEYQSDTDSLHAKSFIFDNRLSAVGSFNLDERSIRIDTETMLLIDSIDFAESLNNALNTYLNKSLKVDKNGKHIPDQNVTQYTPKLSKKILYNVASIPFNCLKYLL